MYDELINKFVEAGASPEFVEKIFSMKKYNRAGFPEYVFNRMDRANPADVDKWLKLSVRYCLKSLQKKQLKEEKDNTEQLKKDFDSLNEADRKQYYQRIRKVNPEIPDFLIKFRAFLLYCNDIEQEQRKESV